MAATNKSLAEMDESRDVVRATKGYGSRERMRSHRTKAGP